MLILLMFLLVWRVSHGVTLRSHVAVPCSLEQLCAQNVAACLWVLPYIILITNYEHCETALDSVVG